MYPQKELTKHMFLLKVHTNSVFLLLLMFASDYVQECVRFLIIPVIGKFTKICTIIFIHKIPTYNIRSKIQYMIPLRIYFWIE